LHCFDKFGGGDLCQAAQSSYRSLQEAFGECLQKVFFAATRITHAKAGTDIFRCQAADELRQSIVYETVGCRDECPARGSQFPPVHAKTETQIDARLYDVPAVDKQYDRTAVAAGALFNAICD
jgi:hypothetical protein